MLGPRHDGGPPAREGAGVAAGVAWCRPVECGLRVEMNLTHEYMHHRTGYRLGAGCCWIKIYKGAECDAPVVVCEELPRVGSVATEGVSGFLAAEVIREHFSDGLPDLPRPLLWIEHRPARRRGAGLGIRGLPGGGGSRAVRGAAIVGAEGVRRLAGH